MSRIYVDLAPVLRNAAKTTLLCVWDLVGPETLKRASLLPVSRGDSPSAGHGHLCRSCSLSVSLSEVVSRGSRGMLMQGQLFSNLQWPKRQLGPQEKAGSSRFFCLVGDSFCSVEYFLATRNTLICRKKQKTFKKDGRRYSIKARRLTDFPNLIIVSSSSIC